MTDLGDMTLDELDQFALLVYQDVQGTRPAPEKPTDPVAPEHAVSDVTDADVIYGA